MLQLLFFRSFDAEGRSVQTVATWRRREAERAHGDDGEMRSHAGIRVHVCQDAESFEHNEATFFFSLSQSRRDTDDKAAERKSLISAAPHWYSDTSVPISSQEWRNITDIHRSPGLLLLIIFPVKKNLFLKLTPPKKKNFW